MADITKPILLDETGQEIKDALLGIKMAVQAQGGGGVGGYYTPSVTQTTASTMQISFSPSDETMPSVAPVIVTLPKGDKGDTPQKGVDYFTEADKQEIINAVLEALPNGDEVSY